MQVMLHMAAVSKGIDDAKWYGKRAVGGALAFGVGALLARRFAPSLNLPAGHWTTLGGGALTVGAAYGFSKLSRKRQEVLATALAVVMGGAVAAKTTQYAVNRYDLAKNFSRMELIGGNALVWGLLSGLGAQSVFHTGRPVAQLAASK